MITQEEGGDDVKSAWLLHPGLHTCYNGQDNGPPTRKGEQIQSNLVSVRIEGLQFDLHEVGIASKRGSDMPR